MNRGTFDGNLDEIKFVANFNSNKDLYTEYLSNFRNNNLWLTRVTSKQHSNLSGKKVFTRSDCYLVNIIDDINNLLTENNFYLSEEILDSNNINYQKVPYSGISIKMMTSEKFQILKTGPDSFKGLFGFYELGAGASLYCKKQEELVKNHNLIIGWKTTINNMAKFYQNYINGKDSFYLDQQICASIKNFANNEIKRIINNSPELQKKIFNGISLYDEPYTAHYFYHGDNITKLTTIPFNVTTGSGRSKGDYTIVLKPC
ncbi:MAG: hypothetical protein E7035_02170 [Verrucomicrobiaceae bacterium]|nr:hypothetical protein [Verrucomicrobiaceae bacterium]